MKKWIICITRISLLFSIIVILFCYAGCAKNIVTKFNNDQFDILTDKIAGLDQIKCNNLKNKTIFTNFNVNQQSKYFLEGFDISENRVNKIEYDGDIGQDIKIKLDKVLYEHCGAQVVNDKSQADIIINANVEKYYSQILDLIKKGDDSFVGVSGEKSMDINFKMSSILSINTRINNDNEDFRYNHFGSIKQKNRSKSSSKWRADFSS